MALDLEASFGIAMGKLDTIHKALPKGEPKPLVKRWGVANTPSALTAQTLIIPSSPAAGRMWFISRTAILGSDGHTSVAAAVADIYAGPGGVQNTADPTAQIYSGLTLPTIIEEGRFHNPVLHGELVYALLYALPAQQIVQFAVTVYDYAVADILAMAV
jgi:hypothetical protein